MAKVICRHVASIPYRLEPSLYAAQLAARGGTIAGLLNAWREGKLPSVDASYLSEVITAWGNADA